RPVPCGCGRRSSYPRCLAGEGIGVPAVVGSFTSRLPFTVTTVPGNTVTDCYNNGTSTARSLMRADPGSNEQASYPTPLVPTRAPTYLPFVQTDRGSSLAGRIRDRVPG